jgi:hypothetical protein
MPLWSGGEWELMKNKLLVALLIVVFLSSAFDVALAAEQCPRCGGTGKITERQPCPTCQGSAASKPNIVLKRTLPGASSSQARVAASVSGVFHNEENFGVYGIATAQIKTPTETFENTSSRTYFPPKEDVTVTVTIEGVKYEPYWSYSIRVSEVENVECPDCGGTGYVSVVATCPDCGGTGVVSGFAGGLTNFEGVGGAVIGVAVVGAVVVAAFVVVKKKRLTEESLRRLSSYEFQDWVVKRLAANPSSQRDSYLGIDGYTLEGYPVQIRQEDDVGKRTIDSFAAAMARSKARNGTVVAFSFGKDAFEGVVKAKLNYRLEIKTVTVGELLASRDRTI